MEKVIIKATWKQLKEIGIDRQITGFHGEVGKKFPTGYWQVKVPYQIGNYTISNNYDIPSQWLEKIEE